MNKVYPYRGIPPRFMPQLPSQSKKEPSECPEIKKREFDERMRVLISGECLG